MNPLNRRLMTSHALAMAVAALLALALGGCGSESGEHATSASPEVAAGSHENVTPVVSNTIDLDEPEVAEDVVEPIIEVPSIQEPAPIAEADSGDIEVRRILATTAIENREPVDPRELFALEELEESGRIYAFFDVRNDSDVDAHLNAVFISPTGQGHGQVELTIPAGARRWRTWAFTRALATGTWDVELRAADGTVLAERRFGVEALWVDSAPEILY